MTRDHEVPKYKIQPSDTDDWFILELENSKIRVDVEKRVLTFRYDCQPHNLIVDKKQVPCSVYCCYAGCYITPEEIAFIERHLSEIKELMSVDSIQLLDEFRNEFYLPEDYDEVEDLYKTRCAPFEPSEDYGNYEEVANLNPDELEEQISDLKNDDNLDETDISTYEDKIRQVPNTHCVFLMDTGLCALHKYLKDSELNWPLHKFNICTTFPLDIRVTSNHTVKDAPYPVKKRVNDEISVIKMMDEFDDFLFTKMDCINLPDSIKKRFKVPFILDSMKYAITSRFGEDFWLALSDYAEKFRRRLRKA